MNDVMRIMIQPYNNIQSVLETEHELETILLGIRVPMRPIPIAGIVGLVLDFPRRYAERDSLVWLSSDLDPHEPNGGK